MTTILLVDDEKPMRDFVRKILSEAGFEVIEANNGKVALDLFRARAFDAVITDIIMPEQEGIETIIAMKRERPGVRILVMSGGGRTHYMGLLDVARKLGADMAIAKPFRTNELLESVTKLLGPGA